MRRSTLSLLLILGFGCSDSTSPPTPATIVVMPSFATVGMGQTQTFQAQILEKNGKALTGSVTWSSSNPLMASVDPLSGIATGQAPGTATITASHLGVSGSGSLTVRDQSPPSVSILNPSAGAQVSDTVRIEVAVSDNHSVAWITCRTGGVLLDSVPIGVGGATSSSGQADAAPKTEYHTFLWPTLFVGDSQYLISVEAGDASGNRGSGTRQLTVFNPPPSVTFSAPASGASLTGTVNVSFSVSHVRNLEWVVYHIDGEPLDTIWPVNAKSVSSGFEWNTLEEANGVHTLRVTGKGVAGKIGIGQRSVTVSNPTSVRVVNQLLRGVHVDLNGIWEWVPASSTETFSRVYFPGQSVELEWQVDPPLRPDGLTFGEVIGGTFDPVQPTGVEAVGGLAPEVPFTIDNIIGGKTYYYPIMTNNTLVEVLPSIDIALVTEIQLCASQVAWNPPICSLAPNAENVPYGFHELKTTSRVGVWRRDRGYGNGWYVYWHQFEPYLQTGSGWLNLVLNEPPVFNSPGQTETGSLVLKTGTAPGPMGTASFPLDRPLKQPLVTPKRGEGR